MSVQNTTNFVSFQHAGRSDPGARTHQEDAYGIRVFQHDSARGRGSGREKRPMELIAVLADGMGGHVGGAIASKIVCGCFMTTYPKMAGAVEKRLLLTLDACNRAMAATIARNSRLKGMGCTMIGISVESSGVRWVSVGDSLLYLFHNRKITRLNEDHSLAPVLDRLVLQGEISTTEARHHPKRNMLRSAITGDDIKLVDLNRQAVPLERGDWLVMASDGLSTLGQDQIEKIVGRNSAANADQIAQSLIAAVKRKAVKGQDNITVLAIGFDKAGTLRTSSA